MTAAIAAIGAAQPVVRLEGAAGGIGIEEGGAGGAAVGGVDGLEPAEAFAPALVPGR